MGPLVVIGPEQLSNPSILPALQPANRKHSDCTHYFKYTTVWALTDEDKDSHIWHGQNWGQMKICQIWMNILKKKDKCEVVSLIHIHVHFLYHQDTTAGVL